MRRPLPHDVQRDLNFYRTVVAFRNAIELMQIVHGTVDDPDQVHWWWGFGYLGQPRSGGSGTDEAGDRPDDPDDLAGSREPRRPYGGAGSAGAAVPEPTDEADVDEVHRASA